MLPLSDPSLIKQESEEAMGGQEQRLYIKRMRA